MPRNDRLNMSRPWCRACFGTIAILCVITLIVSISYQTFGTNPPSESLVMVAVLFRHGDRTPTDTFPTDPYKDPTFWPEGPGALTNKGKLESYNLGKWLREKYSNFLPELYSPNDFHIVSSDHDRCLMSAQLVLAGLYPPKDSQIWNSDLLWQPIPVHTVPRELDQLIVVKKPCPKYDKELKAAREKKIVSKDVQETFEYLTKHAGKNISSLLDAEFLFNTLEIEDKKGLKLPEWTKTVYPEPLKSMATESLAEFTWNDDLRRLRGGPLLKQIISLMTKKSDRELKPDRSFQLYSGHDITVVTLLSTLGVSGPFKPDPSSAVILELHRVDDQYLVEVLYFDDPHTRNLRVLEISRCLRPCSLTQLASSSVSVLPDDWDEECHNAIVP